VAQPSSLRVPRRPKPGTLERSVHAQSLASQAPAARVKTLAVRADSSGPEDHDSPAVSIGVAKWNVGVVSGAPEQEFGRIVAAEFDGERNVYLLDRATQSLRVFDSAGRFVRILGKSGRRPGEFVDPRAVLYDGAGTYSCWMARTG